MAYMKNRCVERENVQKRTFTRWMNLHLEKCRPPLEVNDLFTDIQDGRILMALLEVLTGQSLLHEFKPSAHRIFRLNNIAKALTFLEDSKVKLVSIDAAEIADGNPSLVLGLIWNIILFLQIKELTGNLNRMSSSSSLSSLPSGTESETSQPSTPCTEKSMSVSIKDQRKAIKALLNWVQQRTRKYGVAVQDFGSSWRSGLAFLALIKAIDSSLVDIKKALEKSSRENLEDAFSIAHTSLSIPRLLDPEDLMVDSPDEQSIMTYITQFLEHFPELDAEDFVEQKEDLPLEMTYVHYKDGPIEEEGKIINVNKQENGHRKIHIEKATPLETRHYVENAITKHLENQPQLIADKSDLRSKDVQARDTFSGSDKMLLHYADMSGGNHRTNINDSDKSSKEESVPYPDYAMRDLTFANGKVPDNESPESFAPVVFSEPNLVISNHNSYRSLNSSSNPLFQEDNTQHEQMAYKVPRKDMANQSIIFDKRKPLFPDNTKEEKDIFKYLSHVPKNYPDSEQTKHLTVFQAYNACTTMGEDTPDLDSSSPEPSPLLMETEERNSKDNFEDAKVSVIPHDLFYYPHYSVPIADVLHAFAEPSPGGSRKQNIDSDLMPKNEEEFKSCSGGGFLHKPIEKTNNESFPGRSSEYAAEADTVWDVKPSLTESEKCINPLKFLLNSSTPQESFSNVQTSGPPSDFDYADGIESTESTGETWQLSDEDMKLTEIARRKAHVEERFQSIQKRAAMLDADFKEESLRDHWFSRSSHMDTNIAKDEEYIPNETSFEAFDDHSEDASSGSHVDLRKRRVGSSHSIEKVVAGPEDTSRPDMYYIIFFIWVLCYFVFILPELDLSKVTFFSNNQ
ncbi:calmin isoform X2 [Pelobates fuscus]|uniref:calmin isoform X2 n=1 Tax=Pelobates fuscus TaxID=191477 RepID=UPI002FE4F8CF